MRTKHHQSQNAHERFYPEYWLNEKDACGIGLLADLQARASHTLVQDALQLLGRMKHRGACTCDGETGDGAGIMTPIPDGFFREVFARQEVRLPEAGRYALGVLFMPGQHASEQLSLARACAEALGLQWLGERQPPLANEAIGPEAQQTQPAIRQVALAPETALAPEAFDRKLYLLRRRLEKRLLQEGMEEGGFISLSRTLIVYKGQLNAQQVGEFYHDLGHPDYRARLALVHARFSTNTFPRWDRAHPFHHIAHNGEINTLRGNLNDLRILEPVLYDAGFTREEWADLMPIGDETMPDSAMLDRWVELLHLSGRPLPEVMRLVMPPAWEHSRRFSPEERAYFQYHRPVFTPWGGPAAVCFTDGETFGGILDRNGLRPMRYAIEENGRLTMGSEAGVLPTQSPVLERGRLGPGEMLTGDLRTGTIRRPQETKDELSADQRYRHWIDRHVVDVAQRITAENEPGNHVPALQEPEAPLDIRMMIAHGYTEEDVRKIILPMAEQGKEPIGSMGADIPLAALSELPQHPSHFFKQVFAQVTNPPIDPLRERLVMSLAVDLAPRPNVLDSAMPESRRYTLDGPVLNTEAYGFLLGEADHAARLSLAWDAQTESPALEDRLNALCREAAEAVRQGASILWLEHPEATAEQVMMPSLWALGAVHQHLIREGLRAQCSLLVCADDTWETHHFATLLGFGAEAIYPRMAYRYLAEQTSDAADAKVAVEAYRGAAHQGLLKIMAKMGISTLAAYQGAQLFEAIGLAREVVSWAFEGTPIHLEGLSWDALEADINARHREAWHPKAPEVGETDAELRHGGVYQWRSGEEYHLFNPTTIHLLQHATRRDSFEIYQQFARHIDQQAQNACTMRSLFDFDVLAEPIPLEEVEPAEAIMKRFATGAMSFGSLSHEAHSALAIAMNRIGGKSNSGEGGEDESRFFPKPNGDSERSAIKQVASGRFGVTSYYLAHADELQIKMAQGAKPGEGGQLPGHKVDDWIGRVRHATPGVGLISPPPHHDIYSIEDLAQLISDLKNANRRARINVKLVARSGIGTIAAGVAKAKADVIMISGQDGGTGASPLSSIRHAGLPWEVGLWETHRALAHNGLRERVALQVDGQIRTGRDMAIATLLGAEEYGVATAALVVEGCILMRKCHLNTCPVGVATQDPELRKRFAGEPEHLVSYFRFMAEDLRRWMSRLGFRTVAEMVGRRDKLKAQEEMLTGKRSALRPGVERLLRIPEQGFECEIACNRHKQDHELDAVLDVELIRVAWPALQGQRAVEAQYPITNTDRSVGTMLSNEISKICGRTGVQEGLLHFHFEGTAGQSFGAFGAPGLQMSLRGEANDYVGKGLSGAVLRIYPDQNLRSEAHRQMIMGNVCLYGATGGMLFAHGQAGDRFAVRNSGALAVVEGVGEHGCEYMTGGQVIVLGPVGANFAAGMSGGQAWVYDPQRLLTECVAGDHVLLATPNEQQRAWLREVLQKHVAGTGSPFAAGLLENWAAVIGDFVHVLPKEFQKALADRGKLPEQTLPVLQVDPV